MRSFEHKTCLLCRRPAVGCHVWAKGAGGPDKPWNVFRFCVLHHTEQHKIGWVTFLKKYPAAMNALALEGWSIDERGKLYNPLVLQERTN